VDFASPYSGELDADFGVLGGNGSTAGKLVVKSGRDRHGRPQRDWTRR